MLRIVHDDDQATTEIAPLDLDELCRLAAREMLALALEAERRAYLETHADALDAAGHRLVVGNGAARPREVMTGAGMVPVTAPRVDDRRAGERFRSSLLPPYARRSPKVSEVLPILYLRGLSTGDFAPALADFFGADAGLSASTIDRLTVAPQAEHERWMERDLSALDYVYWWADGIHFRIRLEEDRLCCLVVIGVRPDGSKELVALAGGYRESTESWAELLRDLKSRGLVAPALATADGALGFWAALRDVFPETREQRCWVHKTANVLDKMAKRVQPDAKGKLHEIWMAPTRADANKAFDQFVELYEAKYPGAVECLSKDREALLAFYDFPAEHWIHLRTTNPIESTFATVRLRHRRTKGNGTRAACLAMVFKLCESAASKWRALNGAKLLPDVIAGVKFVNGEKTERTAA